MLGVVIGYQIWHDNSANAEKKPDKVYLCVREDKHKNWVGDVGSIIQCKKQVFDEAGLTPDDVLNKKVIIDSNIWNNTTFGNMIRVIE